MLAAHLFGSTLLLHNLVKSRTEKDWDRIRNKRKEIERLMELVEEEENPKTKHPKMRQAEQVSERAEKQRVLNELATVISRWYRHWREMRRELGARRELKAQDENGRIRFDLNEEDESEDGTCEVGSGRHCQRALATHNCYYIQN